MAAIEEIKHVLESASAVAKDMLVQSPATFDRYYFDSCIKPHIKEVYQRHDLLAPIRKWVVDTIKKPFLFITSTHNNQQLNKQPFLPEMDLTPVLSALAEYQYYVKKNVTIDLYQEHIRISAPELDQHIINELFQEKMVAINQWLNGQFHKLNQGIPVQKRIGIHALSLIWGTAIIGLETISGGLSPLELALDSVIAPYITAGATELFVVNELKSIVHKLRKKYMKALHAIIQHQHNRYINILERLKPEKDRPRCGLVLTGS
jgi:hypothetical protein